MSIADIAVVTIPRLLEQETPAITALVSELVAHINLLITSGESTSIDLRALLSQSEIEHFKAMLGQGEIRATLQAFGPSIITETRIPGVWHIEHRNAEEQTIAELLLVTRCPDILSTPIESLNDSCSLLAELITKNEGE